MLLLRTVLPALVTFTYVGKVTCRPQITATLPFVPGDDGQGDLDDLDEFNDDGRVPSGIIVGTGSAGGTTYIVSASDNGDDRPVTATIIADGSGVTIAATYDHDDDDDDDDYEDDDLFRSVACGIESDTAVCTYARVDVISGSITTTSLATRTAAAERVTFIASTGSVTAADPTQMSGGTGAGAGTGPGASGTDTATGIQQSDTSGARYNTATGILASTLSAVFAAFALA